MAFSTQLGELRRERGMSQAVLAERTGIHASQLYRYEAGTAQPTLDVVRRLCQALAVSADTLVFADDSAALVEHRLRAAYEASIHLSIHEQHLVAEIIEALLITRAARTRPPTTPRSKLRRRATTSSD